MPKDEAQDSESDFKPNLVNSVCYLVEQVGARDLGNPSDLSDLALDCLRLTGRETWHAVLEPTRSASDGAGAL